MVRLGSRVALAGPRKARWRSRSVRIAGSRSRIASTASKWWRRRAQSEASNGGEFLAAIAEQTGIRARVSAPEEARLIHLAASYGVGLRLTVGVVVDIGGGSVEITRVRPQRWRPALGVIRLTGTLREIRSQSATSEDGERYIDAELKTCLKELIDAGFDRVGTSGSILSVGNDRQLRKTVTCPPASGNRRVSAKQVKRVHRCRPRYLRKATFARVPGLEEPKQADIAVAGSIDDVILRRLGAHEHALRLSLREDSSSTHRATAKKSLRQTLSRCSTPGGVVELAERCNFILNTRNTSRRCRVAVRRHAQRAAHADHDDSGGSA